MIGTTQFTNAFVENKIRTIKAVVDWVIQPQ